jgi:hypothetical protein
MHAARLDMRAVPPLLYELGTPAIGELVIEPIARPMPLPRGDSSDTDHSSTNATWLDAINNDERPLQFGEETVLAEITRFERDRFGSLFTIGRVRIHAAARVDRPSMDGAIAALQCVIDLGTLHPTYREPSRHFVSLSDATRAPTTPVYMPIVCPLWARRLGWSQHPDRRFIYRDIAGTPVARTVWWRDGGPRDPREDAPRNEGFLVLLSRVGRCQLEALVGELGVETLCWRTIEDERDDRLTVTRNTPSSGVS